MPWYTGQGCVLKLSEFSNFYFPTSDMALWTKGHLVARPLPTKNMQHRSGGQVSMPRVGFEPTIPVTVTPRCTPNTAHTATCKFIAGARRVGLLPWPPLTTRGLSDTTCKIYLECAKASQTSLKPDTRNYSLSKSAILNLSASRTGKTAVGLHNLPHTARFKHRSLSLYAGGGGLRSCE